MRYYEQQLAQINKPHSIVKIQVRGENLKDENVATNWFNLNKESIEQLREFLDTVESELD